MSDVRDLFTVCFSPDSSSVYTYSNHNTTTFFFSSEWSETDVVERFLKPIGMEFMAKAFIENKINGAVLMCLNEDHMKEMGCAVLGK